MSDLEIALQALLIKRADSGRFRQIKTFENTEGNDLIDFSSNDYLSLTTSQPLRQLFTSRITSAPNILGATGSRLLSGATVEHLALEERMAAFFNAPAALFCNSGWDANVSFFSTIPQPSDTIIYDELVHASVHSGMRAGRLLPKRRMSFKHNDVADFQTVAESAIASSDRGTIFVALESLYSMDGDIVPLKSLLDTLDQIVPRARQCVILDEAHSTGIYGEGGRGLAHALREHRVSVRLMTFGKAVGCSGAVLLCSPVIRAFLVNFARPFIFSTATPHSTLIALNSAWDILSSDEGDCRRQALSALSQHVHARLAPVLARTSTGILRLSTATGPGTGGPTQEETYRFYSPILGLITPRPHELSRFLLKRGMIVRPVVPPTVPLGQERVRLCLRADLDHQAGDRLVRALEEWVDLSVKEAAQEGDVTMVKARL